MPDQIPVSLVPGPGTIPVGLVATDSEANTTLFAGYIKGDKGDKGDTGNPGIFIGSEPPEDTNQLWLDTGT